MHLHRRTFLGSAFGVAASAMLPRVAWGHEKPPFPLYDTHAHFYSNDPSRYPFNSGAPKEYAERAVARAMAHPMTPETIFKMWDENGVALGCGVQYNTTYSTANTYLLDASRAHPDRIISIVILDPVGADAPATLEKMAREDGIAGVRFTGRPEENGEFHFLSEKAAPSWEMADRLGLAIVLMPVGNLQEMGVAMARVGEHSHRYPNVRIVLDHIGFPEPKTLPESFGLTPEHLALAGHRNVFYKYTNLLIRQLQAADVAARPFLEYVVKTYGASKMVWGSDIGNTQGTMQEFVHEALASAAGLSAEEQRALFHDTAAATFIPGGRPA